MAIDGFANDACFWKFGNAGRTFGSITQKTIANNILESNQKHVTNLSFSTDWLLALLYLNLTALVLVLCPTSGF